MSEGADARIKKQKIKQRQTRDTLNTKSTRSSKAREENTHSCHCLGAQTFQGVRFAFFQTDFESGLSQSMKLSGSTGQVSLKRVL